MGLAEEIAAALESYSAEVNQTMQDEIQRMGKEVVKDLKNDPIIPTKTGDYKKGFYLKKVDEGMGHKRIVIANKKYQLTHLLEKGHAVRGGTGRARAYPHWETAQRKVDALGERIKESLKK